MRADGQAGERRLSRQLEATAVYACLAAVVYFVSIGVTQYAYEYAGWLALGQGQGGTWSDMREIARFDAPRGARYFLVFLFMGLLYLCIEEVKSASLPAKLVLSLLVAPLVLPPVCLLMTTRELAALPAWSMWYVICGLLYWQARLNSSWRMDAVVWVLVAVGIAAIVRIDHALWNSVLTLKALNLNVANPGSDARAYFLAPESVYVAGQILTTYVLPRMLVRRIAAESGRAELREPSAEETQPFVKQA